MSTPMRMAFNTLLFTTTTLWAWQAGAAQVVRIGAAHFPPYTIRPERGEDTGLLPQMVSALNAMQHDYRFEMVPTSIPRRFRDFQESRFDMAIFENPEWGWKDIPHEDVDMGLEDAEVFVAHRAQGRTQTYFDELHGKRLALFSGYHYAFARFDADPKFLADNYNATLTYSHDSNLLMVLRDRADIALVTRSYLSTPRTLTRSWSPIASIRCTGTTRCCARTRPSAANASVIFSGRCARTERCSKSFSRSASRSHLKPPTTRWRWAKGPTLIREGRH
jgi:ABC-type amino acid transport substrate-binding protein